MLCCYMLRCYMLICYMLCCYMLCCYMLCCYMLCCYICCVVICCVAICCVVICCVVICCVVICCVLHNVDIQQTGEFDWDKQIQGIVLGSFFWGYLTMQLPGGLLSQKFGPRRVMGVCMIVASLSTLLVSVSARTSPYLLISLRVLTGMGEVL